MFLGEELQMTGAQVSVQKLKAGEDAPFLHSHKTHEEVYVILSGQGEYQVDGEVFPVEEGNVVRVSPAGVRALRNSGDSDMVMMCIQYEQHPISSFIPNRSLEIFPCKKSGYNKLCHRYSICMLTQNVSFALF